MYLGVKIPSVFAVVGMNKIDKEVTVSIIFPNSYSILEVIEYSWKWRVLLRILK